TSKHKIEMKSLVATKTGDVKQVSVALLGMLLTLTGFLGIRKNNKCNI
ncbi:LPXTG cell wall anchor domain-containing protein, partial [Streptococcus agalactiae]